MLFALSLRKRVPMRKRVRVPVREIVGNGCVYGRFRSMDLEIRRRYYCSAFSPLRSPFRQVCVLRCLPRDRVRFAITVGLFPCLPPAGLMRGC